MVSGVVGHPEARGILTQSGPSVSVQPDPVTEPGPVSFETTPPAVVNSVGRKQSSLFRFESHAPKGAA